MSATIPRRRRRWLWLLSIALLAALALDGGMFLDAALDPPPPAAGTTDAIVVLTGGSERVATGFQLMVEGRAARMLISGAHPEAGLAEIAAASGLDAAAFAGSVTIGHAATTTRGNAAETAAWLRAEGLHSLRVVTAGYHMPRAMLEMRRSLPGILLVPHPVPSSTLRAAGALERPGVWALLVGEYGRYILARAGLSGLGDARREMRHS